MTGIPGELGRHLSGSPRILFLTGSGVSAESGVPTFRDKTDGLWASYRPEDLATPEAFARDPELVWQWYTWRRGLVSNAEPNPAHQAIAAVQQLRQNVQLVTQNVDGLHQRAGSPEVVEYHGNLLRDRCTADCGIVSARTHQALRVCPQCGALARPDVVWFGEPIDPGSVHAADSYARRCDVFVSVGTSSLVWPAAGLAAVAAASGAITVEINPAHTPHSATMDFRLAGTAAIFVPQIVQLMGI